MADLTDTNDSNTSVGLEPPTVTNDPPAVQVGDAVGGSPAFSDSVKTNDDSDSESPFSGISLVDMFKQEAAELAEIKDAYIPVQGYEKTGLNIKYRLPTSGKELDDMATKVFRQTKDRYQRNLTLSLDTILKLNEGLYASFGSDDPDNMKPVDPNGTGFPLDFGDMALVNLLGMTLKPGEAQPSPRAVLLKLFGNNEQAVLAHAEKLQRWLSNTKADLSLEFWQLGG